MSLIKLGFGPYRKEMPASWGKNFDALYSSPTPTVPEFIADDAKRVREHGIMYTKSNIENPTWAREAKRHEIVHYLRRDKLTKDTIPLRLKEEAAAYWHQKPKANKLQRAWDVITGAPTSVLLARFPKLIGR
jgi:hypothetical protein